MGASSTQLVIQDVSETLLVDTPVASSQPLFPTPSTQQPKAGTNGTPALLPGLIVSAAVAGAILLLLGCLIIVSFMARKYKKQIILSQSATAIQNPSCSELPPISLELMEDDQHQSTQDNFCEPVQEHVYSELLQEGMQYATPIDKTEDSYVS